MEVVCRRAYRESTRLVMFGAICTGSMRVSKLATFVRCLQGVRKWRIDIGLNRTSGALEPSETHPAGRDTSLTLTIPLRIYNNRPALSSQVPGQRLLTSPSSPAQPPASSTHAVNNIASHALAQTRPIAGCPYLCMRISSGPDRRSRLISSDVAKQGVQGW